MKILAILMMLWGSMFNHQFKRPLMIPHFDAEGVEITAEDEYVKEWLIKNWIYNPGFEIDDGSGGPDGWEIYSQFPTDTIEITSSLKRSGSYSCKIKKNGSETFLMSAPFEITDNMRRFGVNASAWLQKEYSASMTKKLWIRYGTMSGDTFVLSGTLGYAYETMTTIDTWEEISLILSQSEMLTAVDATHLRIDIGLPTSFGYYMYIDDCLCHVYNPHRLLEFTDFSPLNIEDLETFTFGQNTLLDESGGLPLSESTRTADDPVQRLRMADASSERIKLRDSIDIWNMVYLLFSKAQQNQLLNWFKRTRGLTFYWLDEYKQQREVQWVSPPEITPRETNPEIATVNIVLESVGAGE